MKKMKSVNVQLLLPWPMSHSLRWVLSELSPDVFSNFLSSSLQIDHISGPILGLHPLQTIGGVRFLLFRRKSLILIINLYKFLLAQLEGGSRIICVFQGRFKGAKKIYTHAHDPGLFSRNRFPCASVKSFQIPSFRPSGINFYSSEQKMGPKGRPRGEPSENEEGTKNGTPGA